MNEELKFKLLGRFSVQVNGVLISDEYWHSKRVRSLVKLLALAPGHRLQRDQILNTLWPDSDFTAAANNLHQTLFNARKIFEAAGAACLVLEDGLLSLGNGASVDVEQFEAAAARAQKSRDPTLFQAALALYSGDLLPEDLYEEWAIQRRESLRQLHLKLLLDLAGLLETCGETAAAIQNLNQVVALDQAHEGAHTRLMRAYAFSGQRQAALRQYQVMEEGLRRELGVEPAPESQQLREQILSGSLATSAPRFEWLFLPHHNLPVLVSSLIGRERESAELIEWVQAERLVTLTGSGGVGKTRLAMKAAEGLLEAFTQGVFWVDLTSISAPDLLPKAVLEVFKLPAKFGRTDTDLLVDFLKDRRLLLLLDNCEQVLSGCVSLVVTLLEACPKLHILTTSRICLNLPGEISYRVPSLAIPGSKSTPSLAELAQFDAVRLFAERAQSHCQTFSLTPANAAAVAQICERLDGIPLALELAAARTRMLTPEQLAARLKDTFYVLTGGSQAAPLRHKTLRASIDWSYNLLLPKERRFLRRLSVFVGGWTLEAAEAVCADPAVAELDECKQIAATEVLDLLAGLVDHSLVLVEPGTQEARYRMLETIRQYGHEKLVEAGEVELVRQRHLAYYLRLAEQGDQEIRGPHQLEWLKRLEAEYGNFTSALDRSLSSPSTYEMGVLLVCALSWFMGIVSDFIYGKFLQKKALAASADFGRTPTRAKILFCAGSSSVWRGGDPFTPQEVQVLIEESLEIWRELGPDFALEKALCLLVLGFVRKCDFYDVRGFETVQESIHTFQKTGNIWWHAWALNVIVMMRWDSDAPQTIRQILQEETALWEKTGNRWGQALPLGDYGALALKYGDFSAAKRYFQRSLEIFEELGAKGMGFQLLRDLGHVARGLKEYDQAEMYYKNSETLGPELGWRGKSSVIHCGLGFIALHKQDLPSAMRYFCQALKLSEEFKQKNRTLLSIAGLAAITAKRGKPASAVRLFGAVSELGKTYHVKLDLVDQLEIDPYLELCRGMVDSATFDQEWNLGRGMTLEQALAYALESAGASF
jgi:predicted ATPase/DNA-binding SARP family transcriptional activator